MVQFLPVFVFPQILLGGIFLPRDQLPEVLEAISEWLPLSFAIDALKAVAADSESTEWIVGKILVVVAWIVGSHRARLDHATAPDPVVSATASRRLRVEHPIEVRIRESALGVELVAHAQEVVEARVASRAASAAVCVCILPQCGRPSWPRMISSTAAKYSVGSSRK